MFSVVGCQSEDSVHHVISKVDFDVKLPSELPFEPQSKKAELMVNSFTAVPEDEIRILYSSKVKENGDLDILQLNIVGNVSESTFAEIGLNSGPTLINGSPTWIIDDSDNTAIHWINNGTGYILNNSVKIGGEESMIKDGLMPKSFLTIQQLTDIANSFK